MRRQVNQIERKDAISENYGDAIFSVPIFEVGSTQNPSLGKTIPMGQAHGIGVEVQLKKKIEGNMRQATWKRADRKEGNTEKDGIRGLGTVGKKRAYKAQS